jgi:hypothetical protein
VQGLEQAAALQGLREMKTGEHGRISCEEINVFPAAQI